MITEEREEYKRKTHCFAIHYLLLAAAAAAE